MQAGCEFQGSRIFLCALANLIFSLCQSHFEDSHWNSNGPESSAFGSLSVSPQHNLIAPVLHCVTAVKTVIPVYGYRTYPHKVAAAHCIGTVLPQPCSYAKQAVGTSVTETQHCAQGKITSSHSSCIFVFFPPVQDDKCTVRLILITYL